jgi:hypothetical protein
MRALLQRPAAGRLPLLHGDQLGIQGIAPGNGLISAQLGVVRTLRGLTSASSPLSLMDRWPLASTGEGATRT